ncbi:MAG: ABC transporter permease [Trebonia sp.]
MSTATVAAGPQVGNAPASLGHVLHSEWTKLRSVRSTIWALAGLFVVTVGFGVLTSWLTAHYWTKASAADRLRFDPTSTSLAGLAFGQLAIAVLGVMVISAEYSTGGIRTSLTAVPSRIRLLAAKTGVFLVVAFVAGVITSFVAFYAGQAFFAGAGGPASASLADPGVLRAVFGGALYITASGLLGLACGVLLRHTAGAITVAVAFLFVIPIVLAAVPGDIGKAIQRYFTSNAGQQIVYVHQQGNYLTPWVGFGIFCLWFAVPLAAGAWLMHRRDS